MTKTSGDAARGWYYGWNIVAVLIVCQVAAGGLTHNSLSLFLDVWSRDLDAPVSQFTLAIVAQILVGAPMSPIIGALSDKHPSRVMFTIGLAGMAAFFFAVSLATRPWHIVLLYALVAPALTMCTATPANALISRWFVKRIGLALGLAAFGLGLGGVLLPPLLAMLLPEVGWRMIWRGAGVALALIVIPLVLLILRDRPTSREGLHYLAGDASAHPGHGQGPVVAERSALPWTAILSRRNFWLLVFIYLVVMGTGSAMHQNMVPYALSHGMTRETAAILLSIMSVSHLIATLGIGLLTDRFGTRLPLAGLALMVAVGLSLLLVADGTLTVIVIAAALTGFNTGVFTPMAAAISSEFGSRDFGKVFGLAMFFLPVMAPLTFVLARTHEQTGTYAPALVVFIALLLLAALLSLLLNTSKGPVLSSEGAIRAV